MNSRKTVITLTNQLLVLVVNVAALKVTLAALSPDDYGIYGYALSLTGLFMVFSELNLSSVYFKRIAEGASIQRHYSTYAAIRLLLIGAATLCFIFYATIAGGKLLTPTVRHLSVFGILLLYYFFDAVMLAVMGAYQARREIRRTQTTTALMALANLFFIVLFVATTGDVRVFAFSLVVKPLVGIACFARLMKGELNIFRLIFDRSIIADYVRFALPLLPMSILAVVYDRIDGTLVTTFLSYRDNGYLTAAMMFNTLLLIPSTAVMTLLYSLYSEEISRNNYLRVKEMSNRATKYLSMIVSPLSMFCYFQAEPLVTMAMSKEYLPAVPIMRVFMFQIVLMSISRTFDSIILASERLRIVSMLGISLYLFGIVLDFVLIPDSLFGFRMANCGATGPAYKALAFYTVSIFITGILLKKLMNITIYWRFVYHVFAAYFSGKLLSTFLPVDGRIAELALFLLLFGGIYLLFLILIREIRRSDFEYFVRTFAFWRAPAKGNMSE